MVEHGGPPLAGEALIQLERRFDVLEARGRRFEIARIGKAVRPDWAKIGQAEGRAMVLAQVAARGGVGGGDTVAHPARDDGDLLRGDFEAAKFGEKRDVAVFGDEQQLAIGREKHLVRGICIERIGGKGDAGQGFGVAIDQHLGE